jgi:hypothetical protein
MARIISGSQTGGDVIGIDAVIKVLNKDPDSEPEQNSKAPDKAQFIAKLKTCAANLRKPHPFVKGQLLQWKEGLKNKPTPAYGEPIIVVEVLKKPVFDEEQKSASGPYFREPLTLIAGVIYSNGDFMCFHFDGRRFEPHLRNENEEE